MLASLCRELAHTAYYESSISLLLMSLCSLAAENTHIGSMNDLDLLQNDPLTDKPAGLLSLPPEILHEVAIWAPLRTLCRVTRLDVQMIASVRLQRWYRSITRHGHGKVPLSVGDRVLVMSSVARRGIEYATVAAKVEDGKCWKVQMLDGVHLTVLASRIHRLVEWADGSCATSVGRSAALVSASRARGAAQHAATMASQAMRAGVPSTQTALALAAASAASTAAAAATAASSAAAPADANTSASAREAHELLTAAHRVQAAIMGIGRDVGPDDLDVCDIWSQDVCAMVAQAANSAAEAAREASAATSAALAVDSIGSLPVTALTVSKVSSAAQQVVSAIETMEATPSSSAATAVAAATDVLTDVRAAGRALTNSFRRSEDASSGSGASVLIPVALDAAQAAAHVFHTAVEPSNVLNLLDQTFRPKHATYIASTKPPCAQKAERKTRKDKAHMQPHAGCLHEQWPSWEAVWGFLCATNSLRHEADSQPSTLAQEVALDDSTAMDPPACAKMRTRRLVVLLLFLILLLLLLGVAIWRSMLFHVAVGRRLDETLNVVECAMLPQLIVYNTWHKGGTMLATSLFEEVSETCPRSTKSIYLDSQLDSLGLCAMPPRNCATDERKLIHLNSASYFKLHVTSACIFALHAIPAKFIHFIRSPFGMTVSFFLFHLTGQECGFADMKHVCKALTRGRQLMQRHNTSMQTPALVDALRKSIDKLLISPLPQMAGLYIATRTSEHVLTVRLEEIDKHFDKAIDRLLRFLNVPSSVPLYDKLSRQLRRHDVGRWTQAQREESDHVQTGRLVGLTNEAVLAAILEDESRSRHLANWSTLLGYQRIPGRARVRNSGSSAVDNATLGRQDSTVLASNGTTVDQWIHGAKQGFCGYTVAGSPHSCDRGDSGSIGLSIRSAQTLERAVRTCLEACNRCKRCNYITVNSAERDCSWYYRCDMDHLNQQYTGFLSGPNVILHHANAGTTTFHEVVLFMHLEKTGGSTIRSWMSENGWFSTNYCANADDVQRELIELLQLGEPRIFVEHHCSIDWCVCHLCVCQPIHCETLILFRLTAWIAGPCLTSY